MGKRECPKITRLINGLLSVKSFLRYFTQYIETPSSHLRNYIRPDPRCLKLPLALGQSFASALTSWTIDLAFMLVYKYIDHKRSNLIGLTSGWD